MMNLVFLATGAAALHLNEQHLEELVDSHGSQKKLHEIADAKIEEMSKK
jgi:hypothetical protein